MPEFISTSTKVDLTNCDREPIHIPGSIQPHGALLALDATLETVMRHSENAADLLGLEGDLNGRPLETVLPRPLIHALRNAVAMSGDSGRPSLLFGEALENGRRFDIAAHRHKGAVIIEFEPNAAPGDVPLHLARSLIGRIGTTTTVEELTRLSARLIRGALGYDRVMIYQFAPDGSGKVISEVKRADLESFMGQHFPATDIPQQARALYLKNTIRIISSADYRPIPVRPVLDLSGEPLDLSFAHLRSVSPIHLEYLRNMGVGASMSISIIVDGELWGLIACHHYSARTLPMALRVAAEMFGEFLSLHLSALRHKRKLVRATEARALLDRLLQIASHQQIDELLSGHLADFQRLLPSDGIGILMQGRWTGQGAGPPPEAIPSLAAFLNRQGESRIWATHALVQLLPEAGEYAASASGVLAVPLSQIPGDYLLFFRKELVQTVDWAGRPEKLYSTGPMGDRLTPRKSFAIWRETVHRKAAPWSEEDREIAEAMRASLVEVLLRHNELLAEERAKADVRQRMLNEELNHRVKNILAVIRSLVGQPLEEGRTLADYVGTLKGRIQALANAHDQVIRGDGGGALADLVGAELLPYRQPDRSIRIEGPGVWLDARAFSVMALVLHELATNAAKYGSLSLAGGELRVGWSLTSDGDVEIRWSETGGPTVRPPSRAGFGTALLDRSVPYDLGGTSDVAYDPEGVTARFRLPRRHIRRVEAAKPLATAAVPEPAVPRALDPDSRILLVEDQMLIAMDVEAMLSDRGFSSVTTASSVSEALRVIASTAPQLAILDVNLGADSTSLPIAEELIGRGVPFVFATGYGDGGILPGDMKHVPVVRKPYDIDGVIQALGRAAAA